MTKSKALETLRAANAAGRFATHWVVKHGYRTKFAGQTQVPTEDADRIKAINEAVLWSRLYARRAAAAAIDVEAWARAQGWREGGL